MNELIGKLLSVIIVVYSLVVLVALLKILRCIL